MIVGAYHQSPLNSLLKQISHERSSKDIRLQGCNELQKYILSLDARSVSKDAFDTLYKLDELFFTRITAEVKRAIAVCIGAIGYTMGYKYKEYVNWLFKNVEQMSDKTDVKVLYLRALSATLNFDKQNRLLDDSCISKTMSDIQRTLEENDNPAVLIPLLDLASIIANNYKSLFAPHFKDVIDIVAGWYIDTEQSSEVLLKCESTVKALQPFWLENIDFCIDILSQFLEDAEGYIEESKEKRASSDNSIEDCLLKCGALLRAHKVILGTISDCFVVSNETPHYLNFVQTFLKKTSICIENVLDVDFAEANEVLSASSGCLQVLLSVCRLKHDMVVPKVMELVEKMCRSAKLEQETLLEVLKVIKDAFGQVSPDLMVNHIDDMIGVNGYLKPLRFHPDHDVSVFVLSVYKTMLVPKGITALQRVYGNILSELLMCLKCMGPSTVLKTIDFGSVTEKAENEIPNALLAEWIFVFLVSILMELGSAKNSLIAMLGLSPSLFELLCRRLPLTEDWFASGYSAAHYTTIVALKSHSDRHENFVSNCEWLINSTRTPMLTNVQTSKHLQLLLDLLTKLLPMKSICADTRRLCLIWIQEISQLMTKLAKQLLLRPEFVRVVDAVLQSAERQGSELPEIHVDTIKHLLSATKLDSNHILWKRVLQTCTILASDKGQHLFLSVLEKLPLVQIVNCTLNPADLLRRQLPSQIVVGSGLLTGQHFRLIADFFLEGIAPSLIAEETSDRLWCDSVSLIKSECSPVENWNQLLSKQPAKIWQWVLWQTADYCVNNRLKTPFGRNVETFAVFENEIRSLASETVKGPISKVDKSNDDESREELIKIGDEPDLVWFRVRSLLIFMESLDKLMYNAYEGSAFALPTVNKIAKPFFRTNRAVCRHWIDRIRLALMTVALNNQHYGMVIRLANDALLNWGQNSSKTKPTPQTELLLMLTAEAMQKSGCGQAIIGLYTWSKLYLELRVTWLKFASEMAHGRYESAAAGFASLLATTNDEKSDDVENGKSVANISSTTRRFLANQTLECYFSLRDFTSAKKWVETILEYERKESENGTSAMFKGKDLKYLKSLGQFDEDFDQNDDNVSLLWSQTDQRKLFESRLNEVINLEETNDRRRVARELTGELRRAQKVRFWSEWPQAYTLELEIGKRLAQTVSISEKTPAPDINITSLLNYTYERPAMRQNLATTVGFWVGRLKIDLEHAFWLQASRLSRKNHNYNLAGQLISKHSILNTDADPCTAIQSLFSEPLASDLLTGKWLPMARHSAKLLRGLDQMTEGFSLLTKVVSQALESVVGPVVSSGVNESLLDIVSRRLAQITIISTINADQTGVIFPSHKVDGKVREEMSRSLLLLADWLQNNAELGNIFFQNEDSVFVKLIEEQLHYAEHSLGAIDKESVVGAMLTMSAFVCPEFIKAQRTLADWAYRAGKKAVEGSSRDEHVLLTTHENAMVVAALPEDASAAERDAVFNLVSSLKADDGGLGSVEELVGELQLACPRLMYLDTLAEIWQNANKRLFMFYNAAAKAYFQFLKFCSENSITSVTATLRLLRLLVKHISNLDPTLQDEFENTNPQAWKCVMPQVFARLNHPSAVVRETLCRLLERMAICAPHLVCYPALIGVEGVTAIQQEQILFTNAETEEDENEVPNEADETLLESSCERLVEVLKKQDSQLVEDTRLFIDELQRITLLREEKWLTVLGYLQHDVTKRLRQLEEETEKTMRIDHLSATEKEEIIKEKTVIYTRMVFKTLEDLFEKTCKAEAETPNEQWFVTQYSSIIESALNIYSANNTIPSKTWEPFRQLLSLLNQRSTKRGSLSLDMNQISPVLAQMTQTRVPLPGQGGKPVDQLITVAAIDPLVSILPTKTRPKKIYFIGSDGKKYPFLFKGQEDLHLDERIMQFLQVCNLMLAEKNSEKARYYARNYSVTPLGPRSGLIQWVDNATAMFRMYRNWQVRESSSNVGNQNVPRPSEIYYGKLAPALEQKGIKDLENRQKWPLSALRSVLSELIAETPNDLLAKEIWCRSANPDIWWELTQRFARSCAVMSVIGYVIGLGDRHLDNVLVDIDTGEIVHIDYNICFEKGKHLRVPETVPFRMSANMQTALGPTGVEGIFRLSCEEVLRVLRSGRETLLTLLEAFVYDPLIDWAGSHELGAANFIGPAVVLTVYGNQKQADSSSRVALELACKMFTVRRKELSVPWNSNREILSTALQEVTENLARIAAINDELEKLVEKQRRYEEEAVLTQVSADNFTSAQYVELESALRDVEAKQVTLREQIALFVPIVQTHVNEVKSALSAHHRMMLDIRLVLKSMAKMEEQAGHRTDGPFNLYMSFYKENFVEPLAACLRIIGESNEWSCDQVVIALKGLALVLTSIDRVYDMLLQLDFEQTKEEEWPSLNAQPNENKQIIPTSLLEYKSEDKPKRSQGAEERNVHAMSIWRRVRLKLEGRDPDQNKRSSVQEQISYILASATSMDNLSLMYEGWTAWV